MAALQILGTHKLDCERHRKVHEPQTPHRILKEQDLRAGCRPRKNESASDHVSNSRRPGLTGCIVEATERWISQGPCIES